MVFDLRAAMLRKEEIESARLADFDWRLRVVTMRLLAADLRLPERDLVTAIAHAPDEAIVADLATRHPAAAAAYGRWRAEARRRLIAERGDPAPHRLA